MPSGKAPGIDIDSFQKVADGTLCRAVTHPPGITGIAQSVASALFLASNPTAFVYCNVWSDADRKAFWRGFLGRVGEFGSELKAHYVWFCNAFGLGTNEGDAQKAWSAFGDSFEQLAELGWKVTVVAGVPPPLLLHPKRNAYARELSELGVQIGKHMLEGYKKAAREGGVPQCTGMILADLLRLVFEILLTKGIAKGASALSSSKVLARLPAPLRKIPARIKARPTRMELIQAIKHSGDEALYAEGILTDLTPGKFLVRAENRVVKSTGSWFNGPFNSRKDAEAYVDYLASLGKDGIRHESALPEFWKDAKGKLTEGNKVEVIRIYEVKHPTPAISSVAAPQAEGGMRPIKWAGQGQQLSLPVGYAKNVHELDLVQAVGNFMKEVKKP